MSLRIPLLSIVYYHKVWYLQLSIDRTVHWNQACHVRSDPRKYVLFKIGRGAAAHSSQRLILLLVTIITNAGLEEVWGFRSPQPQIVYRSN